MKAKLVVTVWLDSEKERWVEHGKPFGLSRRKYLKEVVARSLVDSMDADPEKTACSWFVENNNGKIII